MTFVSASESSIAMQARSMFATHVWSTMKKLDDLDYDSWTQWKLELEVVLGLMDLDLALREDKPSRPTETCLPEEKIKYEKWEESNRISLLLMRSKMSNYVHLSVPKSESAKQCFDGIENLVMKFEKDGEELLFDKLIRMKYDGEGNVREHILRMCGFANRLKDVGRKICEGFFLSMVIGSLPSQFDDFRTIAQTKGWKLDDYISMCGIFEEFRKDDMAGPVLGKRRRMGNTNYNGYDKNVADIDGLQGRRVGNKRLIRCFSCGGEGYHKEDCTN